MLCAFLFAAVAAVLVLLIVILLLLLISGAEGIDVVAVFDGLHHLFVKQLAVKEEAGHVGHDRAGLGDLHAVLIVGISLLAGLLKGGDSDESAVQHALGAHVIQLVEGDAQIIGGVIFGEECKSGLLERLGSALLESGSRAADGARKNKGSHDQTQTENDHSYNKCCGCQHESAFLPHCSAAFDRLRALSPLLVKKSHAYKIYSIPEP